MLVIGLTGGAGSGKSTVAELFAKLGVPIIDTDLIARELTQPNQQAFEHIIKKFGKGILLENGNLNRAKLRKLIFSDSHLRRWLENLLHPVIKKEMENRILALDENTPYCIVVVPLLFEVEFYALIQRILVIDTEEHLQIARVMARDQNTEDEVKAMLKTQSTRQDRLSRAHDIITNHGSREDLITQVENLHKKYLHIALEDKK